MSMTIDQLETHLQDIKDGQERQGEKLDKVCLILTGNGEPKKGLVLRFDRVEQSYLKEQGRKTKFVLACIFAGVTFIGGLGLFLVKVFFFGSV